MLAPSDHRKEPRGRLEAPRGPLGRLASAAISLYLAFTFRTVRWRHVGDPADLDRLGREAAIIAFWHECLPCMPMLWRRVRERGIAAGGPREAHVLISRHRDGQLISRIVARFGLVTVAGSSGREKQGRRSERGGAAGFRRLLALLRSGQHVGITPDGPRGPAHQVQLGVAQLAAVSGAPVTPCAVATRPALRLPSWDRMALPLPFGRGAIVVLPHVVVGRDAAAASVPAIGAALDEAMRQARAALRG